MNIESEDFWIRAQELIVHHELEPAEQLLRDALSKYVNHPKILDALGEVLLLKGDLKGAKLVLTISMKLEPHIGAEKYFNLAQLSSGKEAIELSKKRN